MGQAWLEPHLARGAGAARCDPRRPCGTLRAVRTRDDADRTV